MRLSGYLDRLCLLLLFGILGPMTLVAQQNAWELLLKPDADLRKDVIQTEQVIDLVQARVADSLAEKNKQRLKGIGGWIAQRTWRRFWLKFTDAKQRYVGTSSRDYHVFNGPGDEVDINIFIMPHLPQYIRMVRSGFDEARKRPRGDKGFRFDSIPDFPLPPELKVDDYGYITVECEVTPPQDFADVIAEMLVPTHEGVYIVDSLPNFGTPHPSFGMTGVWCMDCNHNCRPEIHPIEWLWWLDMSSERPGSENAKSWLVSLMVDGSNRFNDWTPSPIMGEIALPFAIDEYVRTLDVSMTHVASDPSTEEVPSLPVPTSAYQSGDTTFRIPLPLDAKDTNPIRADFHVEGNWPTAGTRYWISDFRKIKGGFGGYLHVATQVKSLMAMRITFDYQSH